MLKIYFCEQLNNFEFIKNIIVNKQISNKNEGFEIHELRKDVGS